MAMIKLPTFGGVFPRTGVRLLPETGAQSAENFKLQSGELRPLRGALLSYVPLTPKTSPPLTMFKARTGTSSSAWFTWPIDVNCVRVPLGTDVESRFCWTGDGPPKMITYTNAVSGGGNNYPLLANELTLGIPTPQTLPTVSPSGGAAADVTRFYCYTFVSALGEESAPSPVSLSTTGKPDGTWSISVMDTAPANSGTGTAAYGSVTTFTMAASGKHWLRVGDEIYFTAGVGIVTTLMHTVASIPSATTFTVTGNYATATAWSRKTAWNTASMVKRLYRTVGTAAEFQLVADNIPAATTTYSDTLSDTLIPGDSLVSVGWVPPPVGLVGLGVHASGALYGFVGNLLCFSEPLQPHAWPEAYRLSAGFNGVGVSSFGSTVVMATAGVPFIASGVEPASMTGEDAPGVYPCLAKRSVISTGDAVLYASKYGLISVGSQGVNIFTDPYYTRDEWEALNPSTMVCERANGRYYISYADDSSVRSMLIFADGQHTTSSVAADSLYTDPADGELYIGTSSGISHWDDSTKTALTGNWRSKEFVFPAPVNLGAAKVDFEVASSAAEIAAVNASIAATTAANAVLIAAGSIAGAVNAAKVNGMAINGSSLAVPVSQLSSNTLTFSLYTGDILLASRTVTGTGVFRLPSGYKVDNFSVEITTACAVKEIRVAETPDGLRVG